MVTHVCWERTRDSVTVLFEETGGRVRDRLRIVPNHKPIRDEARPRQVGMAAQLRMQLVGKGQVRACPRPRVAVILV
jgi:hypothetical protein